MKIELDNICPSIRKCFFYRQDLENMDTEELLHILRCLRISITKEVERNYELVDEDKKKEKKKRPRKKEKKPFMKH